MHGPPLNVPLPEMTDNATVAPLTAAPSWSRTETLTAADPPSTIAEGAEGTAWMNRFVGRWMLITDQKFHIVPDDTE